MAFGAAVCSRSPWRLIKIKPSKTRSNSKTTPTPMVMNRNDEVAARGGDDPSLDMGGDGGAYAAPPDLDTADSGSRAGRIVVLG